MAQDLDKGDLIVDVVGDPNAPGIREMSVSGVIEARPDDVWKVVIDIGKYTKFQPRVEKTELRVKKPKKIVAYHKLKVPPPLPEMWYVMEYNIGRKGLMTFKMLEGSPKTVKGSFKVVPYKKDKKRTLAVYTVLVDPGLPLPASIINQISKFSLPEVLQGYRDEVYRRSKK